MRGPGGGSVIVRRAVILVSAATVVLAGAATAFALALTPPVLEPFKGGTHTSSYLVEGSVDSLRLDSWVRIRRNGVVVDSVSTAKSRTFSVRIPLLPGDNTITAVLRVYRPTTWKQSEPSNAVHVTLAEVAGFFIPVPFPPGGSFDLNTATTAAGAELRVFDMAGDEVVRFESRDARTFYSFVWDGLNGGDEAVRRGPLIAVGIVHYPDGTSDVKRRAFLYDPGALR